MHPLAGRRGRAYALDCLCYLGIAGAMVPVGLAVRHLPALQDPWAVVAVSALPPVVATVLAAWTESGPRGATPGKRRVGLTVRGREGDRPRFGRTLARNAVKIALPWQLGHVVAVLAADGGFERRDPALLTATALTYPVVGLLVGGVLLGSGRPLHDRLAGTTVTTAASS
ncbi:RDD family protein [Auraticoccus monumenti]|uniref:RDD family protein n=1 Tax=Auraticoccus monumenti TaxID=675864 RepID=A0A1G6ZIZ6_9ACTN|nr:RDD family protein [Auraticoccus monumenti]SDE01765.1 RDD family protein [Auraticoccus monumenti]